MEIKFTFSWNWDQRENWNKRRWMGGGEEGEDHEEGGENGKLQEKVKN